MWVFAVLAVPVLWWVWEKRHRRTYPVPPGIQTDIEIPAEQEFELYHNALSLCSMKSRVCLAELGIDYKSHHIDLIETGSYENIGRRLLAVNPGGTVPVLIHNGHPVYESHEQIRYAAQFAAPGRESLVPDDPSQRQQMEAWIDRSSITHDPIEHGDESIGNCVPGLTLPLFATMIERIATWKILEGFLFHFDKQRPAIFLTFKLGGIERLPVLGPAIAIHRRSRRQAADHLDALEQQLNDSGGPWILGEHYSLADVSWLVVFERFEQVDSMALFLGEGQRPACAAYWQRLRERPAYREAITDHSHPIIEYGTQRIQEAKAANPTLRQALGE